VGQQSPAGPSLTRELPLSGAVWTGQTDWVQAERQRRIWFDYLKLPRDRLCDVCRGCTERRMCSGG